MYHVKMERVKKKDLIFFIEITRGILPDFYVNWVSAPKHGFSCYSMLSTMYDFLAHDFWQLNMKFHDNHSLIIYQ